MINREQKKLSALTGCLLCICVGPVAASSSYPDYSQLPLPEIIEQYNRLEQKLAVQTNDVLRMAGGGRVMMNAIGKKGDRSALPFLEEKSISTNLHAFVREGAAQAYVKIADLDESVAFMRKLYEDPSATGSWRYFLNKKFLEKVRLNEKSLRPKTKEEINSFLLGVVQKTENSGDAHDADLFLLDSIPEYANSKQRATLNRYANTGNEWVTNTFNPIKEYFDKIPPSKRVDLRDRFPSLPPLPGDKTGKPLKVALVVSVGLAALVVLCAAILVALKRRRTRNHADGQPDNPQ